MELHVPGRGRQEQELGCLRAAEMTLFNLPPGPSRKSRSQASWEPSGLCSLSSQFQADADLQSLPTPRTMFSNTEMQSLSAWGWGQGDWNRNRLGSKLSIFLCVHMYKVDSVGHFIWVDAPHLVLLRNYSWISAHSVPGREAKSPLQSIYTSPLSYPSYPLTDLSP